MPASLRFDADLRSLKHIRRAMIDAANQIGARRDSIDDVVYAANELISNTITYGYGNQAGPIWIDIWQEGDTLYVSIRDTAPVFDPLSMPLPRNLIKRGQQRIGGLGLFLTRHLLDDLQHRPLPGGGNELLLIKRRAF